MIEALIFYATTFLHVQYNWGGNHYQEGVDCSGYVLECLRGVGYQLPDMNAQGIYHHFKDDNGQCIPPERGALLFFGKSVDKITHVALGYSGKLMLEAGGGGRETTKENASESGAEVRMRGVSNRRDFVAAIRLRI